MLPPPDELRHWGLGLPSEAACDSCDAVTAVTAEPCGAICAAAVKGVIPAPGLLLVVGAAPPPARFEFKFKIMPDRDLRVMCGAPLLPPLLPLDCSDAGCCCDTAGTACDSVTDPLALTPE